METTTTTTTYRNYLTNIINGSYFTKDIPSLERYHWHYLFVYDDLKKGLDQNDYLAGAELISTKAYTSEARYEMKYLQNKGYKMPYIRFTGDKNRNGYIRGDLYRVFTEEIIDIDTLNNNGEMYFRVKLPIIISSHTKQSVLAWTYMGNEPVLRDTFNRPDIWSINESKFIGTDQSRFYIFGGNK